VHVSLITLYVNNDSQINTTAILISELKANILTFQTTTISPLCQTLSQNQTCSYHRHSIPAHY